ncbi:7-cyano-7-deazaguanine synthase, partial [bacterium]|nr:7-cyano-7-deazaguanine synthase [bacterium]
PYTNIDKRAIALIGNKIGIDYSKTWTCYKGKDVHCGVCGSCTERKEALSGFDNTGYLS